MSSPPQEAETCDVELSWEEEWVVHHSLSTRANEAIDDGDVPPDWLFELLEAVEDGVETLTTDQARNLHDVLTSYAAREQTSRDDADDATAVSNRLEARLEA